MDERRDQPPDRVTRPSVIVSGAAKLSPLQQAWSRYVTHTTNCPTCRDIDQGRCEDSGRLWNAYRAQGDEAYRRLSEETP
ncbi:hypothetical protein ACFXI6_13935 [Streptomyces mirabilis]|uniref:hypothetical protein n=1 Tax=Streptomyces mirabilis TaxID=68239 RepID=UPI0036BCC7A9